MPSDPADSMIPAPVPDPLQLLEHIYRTLPVGIAFIDRELRFVRINDMLAEINGLPAEEHIGKHLRDIVPDLAPVLEPIYESIFRTGEPLLNVDIDRHDPDPPHELRHYRISFYPVKLDDGEILGVSVAVLDVTEEKRAEAALRKSEALFRAVVEDQTELIVRWKPDGVRTFVNRAYCERFGLSRDEAIGTSFFPLIRDEDLQRVKARLARLSPEAPVSTDVHRVVLPDGSVGWQEWTDRAIYDEHGNLLEYQSVGRDITEQKRAEERLRASEQRYRALVENAPVCIHEIDLQGRILSMNPAGLRMLGVKSEEQIIGRSSLDVVCEEDRPRVAELLEQALQGRGSHFEFKTRPELGSRVFASSFVPIIGPEGQVERLMGVTEDITEEREAMALLKENEARLAQLSRQLISAQENERRHIAQELHDEIGQVLSTVSVHLKLLRGAADATIIESIDQCIAVTDQAIQQVRNMSLDLRPAMLDDIGLKAALEWYVRRLPRPDGMFIQFEADVHTPAPLPEDVRNAVFRVAQEALTNILRHAQARNVRVRLEQNGGLRLIIEDDGIGFDVKQAEERARRGGSLGLLGMRERIELIGGEFDIESSPGTGTRIRVAFSPERIYGDE